MAIWLGSIQSETVNRGKGQSIFPTVNERRFWSIVVSYGLGALPLGPLLYLAPLYLSRAFDLPLSSLGRYLWAPPLGWELGYYFGGWFVDRYEFAVASPGKIFSALTILGLPLVFITHLGSPVLVVLLMFWSLFTASGFIVASLRAGAALYEPEQRATVAGIAAGSWSAIVALLIPQLGKLFDAKKFALAFAIVGLAPLVGTLLWFILSSIGRTNATKDRVLARAQVSE